MTELVRSLNIANAENWGKLVKSWATGNNYFDPGQPAPTLPHDIDELMQQCRTYECGAELADWVKGLAVVQYSAETLALRLPPKSMIERSEAALRQANGGGQAGQGPQPGLPELEQGAYPLPEFYTDFLRIRPDQRTLADLEAFHHARIGEYTVNSCQ
jgi:hypothetical protein